MTPKPAHMKIFKHILILVTFTALAACGGGDSSAPASSWVGTKQLGAANQLTFGNAVATDSSGNVYVTGSTTGGLDGNTLTGTYDFFVTKYNSSGVKLFTKQMGITSSVTVGTAVATDANGNVYIAGYTTGGLDGNTKMGSTHDLFVTKYDSSGVKQFTRQLGAAGAKTVGIGLVIDVSGNFYIGGYTTGGLDGNVLTGTIDFFLTKYNSDGVKQFTRQLGTAGQETRGYGVATDVSGNVFIAGYTEGSLDGNTLTGTDDFFVTKYNSNGVKQFTRQLGAVSAATVATAVATDDSGNVFVVGYTTGGLDGNTLTGTYDFFVTKFNSSGVKQFTRQLGAAGGATFGNEITIDASGNIYIGGATGGSLDGNVQMGTDDFFFTKFDNSGVKQYTRQLGVTGRETDSNGIAIDVNGNIYIAGSTGGGLDGNTLTGTYDFFVTKFNSSGVKQ
jgi:hypothetical protein